MGPQVFNLHVSTSAGVADGATEDIWNNIKTGLLKTTEEMCGTTRPHRWRRETWWWFVCIEVLRPSQPNGVMSSAVSLPNHTFTGQA